MSELDNIGCSEKTGKAIVITKDLIKTQSKLQNRNEDLVKEKELLLNAKEEWEKEKKRLRAENSTLREQLKILRSKQFGKSSEKTKKRYKSLNKKSCYRTNFIIGSSSYSSTRALDFFKMFSII